MFVGDATPGIERGSVMAITVVPEPGALGLRIAALAMLALLAWCRARS
jgi:hypothetical protein